MRVLIVEDELKMARMLQRGLLEEGYQVDVCTRGSEAETQLAQVDYDVVVLDWGLPDLDGLSLLRALRDRGLSTPILMLTARGTTGEKITGLRAGADDYLVKPFAFEELLARLEALSRRNTAGSTRIRAGSLELEPTRRTLRGPTGELALSAREFALSKEFIAHPGEVLTRSRLLSAVWGGEVERTYNLVDVYVGYLRQKIAEVGAHDAELSAVRGMGYRLVIKARP